jgi:hypothetical protein
VNSLISVSPDFPAIEPVLLVCAKDTAHAEEIGKWLLESRAFQPEELLVTHSEKTYTEADIQRLVAIDHPGNKIRVVVNVFRLTEGWDVTNVYVIATLRAMATFAGAIQTSGRGLRLPQGKRTGNPDVDTLDVLCCGLGSGRASVAPAPEVAKQHTSNMAIWEYFIPASVVDRVSGPTAQVDASAGNRTNW